jgi:hypothetical protein
MMMNVDGSKGALYLGCESFFQMWLLAWFTLYMVLPTKGRLHKSGYKDGHYSYCGKPKDVGNIFWWCLFPKDVWA